MNDAATEKQRIHCQSSMENASLEDKVMFADDVVLCGERAADIERELESWSIALEEKGLKINRTKTVQLNFGMENGDTISLDGVDPNKVVKFEYLGSTTDCKGELDCEIAQS
ncbi:hypothetical protein M8J76_012506 [Diaphorina citri]|nr:hypothetical protein M8J76_012506 [Diaphorina citri]